MKIAVTNENNEIFQHFGRCPSFKVYDINDNAIAGTALIDVSDSGHSALIDVLQANGINLLICGGIGGGAQQGLKAIGIEFISGVTGNTDAAVDAYLKGQLQDDPALGNCNHHHDEEHECAEHTCGH